MRKIRESVLKKNIIINVLIILVLMTGIILTVYLITSKKITAEIEEQIHITAQSVESEIMNTVELQERQLSLLATTSECMHMMEGTASEDFSQSATLLIQSFDPYMENLLLIDQSGMVIYDSSDALLSTDLSDRSYFQGSMKGEICHSEILTSKATGHQVEVVSVPITQNDKIIGVLATTMNTEYLFPILEKVKIGESGYAFLLDQDGNFIYHPKEELRGENISTLNIEALNQALSDMQSGNSGKVYYTYNGDRKILLYLPTGNYFLAINAITAEYLSSVYRMILTIVVIGILMTLLASLITAFNSKHMVNRINGVKRVMESVTEGDLSHRDATTIKEACWDVMQCEKEGCIAYKNDNHSCWELDGTLCQDNPEEGSRLHHCRSCNFYNQTAGDEIGKMSRSMSVMVSTMKSLITRIADVSESVASSSEELASSSEETSSAALEISQMMEGMNSNSKSQSEYIDHIDEMTHSMNTLLADSVVRIEDMHQVAENVSSSAELGGKKMDAAITDMGEIKSQTERLNQVMEELLNQSREIGEITAIITSISDETNLLALNASIEAARAGEKGRGFGVVADEIGKLANQSQSSAHGISDLIKRISESIVAAHDLMDHESRYVENGIGSVSQAKISFQDIQDRILSLLQEMKDIVRLVDQVKVSSSSVTEAIDKMTDIIEETGSNIDDIAASTQQQASVSEEIANAATELATMSEELLESISDFKI